MGMSWMRMLAYGIGSFSHSIARRMADQTAYRCLARAEVEAKLRKAAIKTLRSAELKKQFNGAGMRSTTQGEKTTCELRY
jgi:hypothetical protein